MFADVIVSKDCDLNTIISATIELEGGSDELGRPISKSITAGLLVGERRDVTLEGLEDVLQTYDYDSNHVSWINLTSTSTKGEVFDVIAEVPEGWGVICDGSTIHTQITRVELDPGHIIQQSYDMRCEVIRESGTYTGIFTIFVNGSDSRINFTISDEITWIEPTSDESNATILVTAGVGIIILISGILIFIRRESSEDDFEEKYVEAEPIPSAGPPSTAFSGPPATAEPAMDEMIEYQRQVEEYNRKMAEYNAWQEAQGSQVSGVSTNHE